MANDIIDIERYVTANRARLGMSAGESASAFGSEHRLAVYGTLRPGGTSAHMLAPYGGMWSGGIVRGYQLGACTESGCPGLAWDPAGEKIEVQVLESPELAAAWVSLDAYEGSDLVRIVVPVEIDGAGIVAANLYASADATRARLLMRDGGNVHDTVDDRL